MAWSAGVTDQQVETFEKRKFLFIHKGKSHRLNTRFRGGSVFDLSHMNEGYAPQNPGFCWFSKFERLFFEWIWLNLIQFASICIDLHRSTSIYIDLHRSTSICLALNLKISCIFWRYQNFDSPSIFHNYEWRICSPKSRILLIFKIWKVVFWVNLIEFDSICIDLRRSASIYIDPHRSTSIHTHLPRSEP